jgi:hypothetical protein
MTLKSCRDCANFEDRRDIEGTTLCSNNVGPYVCCEEFEPRDPNINKDRLYSRFCPECTNFEDIGGTFVCSKKHTPQVSCGLFTDRFSNLSLKRQNKQMQTTLIAKAIKSSNPTPVPEWIIKIGQKMEW